MQKIREQVLVHRDKVYQDNEGEVRKRWHFEDAVSSFVFVLDFFNFFLTLSLPLLSFTQSRQNDDKMIFRAIFSESKAGNCYILLLI